MRKILTAGAVLLMTALAVPAHAELDTDKLDGVKPSAADHPLDKIISGYEFRNKETQMLQDDDFDNPAFIWVDTGEELWSTVDGKAGKSCQECHNDASETMKGVKASYPKWNESKGKPVTIQQQVNICRTEQMQAEEWKWESEEMLGMAAYVASQSRGMPVNVKTDGKMTPWFEKGKDVYYPRWPARHVLCELPRGQLRQEHSRRHAQPGPDQRFPDLQTEMAEARVCASPFQGLHEEHPCETL